MSLDVGQGEFLSLLGPSGCGKSTALRHHRRPRRRRPSGTLDWPTASDAAAGRDDIGFVFQEPTLMPWATVFDNVWLPLRLRGIVARRAARAEVMEALAHGRPRRLRRRLSARALRRHEDARLDRARAGHQAELLLMDEPFAALDEITRFKLNDDLLRPLAASSASPSSSSPIRCSRCVFLSSRIVVMAARPGRVFDETRRRRALSARREFPHLDRL